MVYLLYPKCDIIIIVAVNIIIVLFYYFMAEYNIIFFSKVFIYKHTLHYMQNIYIYIYTHNYLLHNTYLLTAATELKKQVNLRQLLVEKFTWNPYSINFLWKQLIVYIWVADAHLRHWKENHFSENVFSSYSKSS